MPVAPVRPPPSPRATTDRLLFARMHDPLDPVDLDAVAARFLPLAHSVARRHTARGQSFDDVYQVACLALVKAIDRFDTTRTVAFSSFAVPTMIGEVKRYYRDWTWACGRRGHCRSACCASSAPSTRRAPARSRPRAPSDLARLLQVPESEVRLALQAREARRAASLDLPAGGPGSGALAGSIGRPDDALEAIEQRILLRGLLKALTARERNIVWLRYGDDLTQAQIGREVGLSQMQVSRILSAAVHRMQILALAPACRRGPDRA